jgi:peptidoglycan/LPS O-acetylase OafA/YrhL
LLTLARERLAAPGRWVGSLAASSYSTYVVHLFVVVALQLALVEVAIGPLAKFWLVAGFGIVLSFAVGSALRRLPGINRVL